MNSYKIKKLNLFKLSLNGINLIEASAGTGKTFTIVLLYLRLLLGIGNKKKNIRKFSVHEILVVTFTNAAKEELYIRIKNNIKKLYFACLNKNSNDPIFQIFLKEIDNIEEAIYTLKQAQENINNLSIYTIHGFCQKILQLYTLDFNPIFEERIIEDEDNLHLQATQDFWRRFFYPLSNDIIEIISKEYHHPNDLLKEIKPFLNIKSINFEKKTFKHDTLITFHKNNIKKINNFKKKWLIYYPIILKKIDGLDVNKRIYNKCNISRWINNITLWAQSHTINYNVPISLKYFTKKNIEKNTINNICSKHVIFKETEKFLKKNFSLKNIIIFYAIKKIPQILLKEKKKKSLLGFNDLLNMLLKNIKKEKFLKNLISTKYPIAFIDEFQDTDIQQYEIFNIIYKNQEKTALFLIGDPKQAIYSFRGADIFSYLYAKSKIKKHYYLDINWRSSIDMCKSINYLFSQNKNPFIFKNIPFISITPSLENSKLQFSIKGINQKPINFFFQEKEETNLDNYQVWIATQCSNEVSYWLYYASIGEAKIRTKNGERILKPNDIAILVRNGKEANIIQTALKKININSIYSSYKKNIFQSSDAQELLWILESILEPTNEKYLQQSISTHILKKIFFIKQIESKNKNSYFIIEKLCKYHDIWEKIGIFQMIKKIILDYQKKLTIKTMDINYQKNLNFLYIAELLQEQSQFFHKKTSLVRWFKKKTYKIKQSLYNENIICLDESQSIKIITIHKSKGLEYPIVWIPFGIDFNLSKKSIYHDQKTFKTIFDIEKNNMSLKLSDQERLAEDLRFLYVALTRSIFHCSIGIACLVKKKMKNRKSSDIHLSALGYIIQNGKNMNYENLSKKLKKISDNNLIKIKKKTTCFPLNINKKTIYLIDQLNSLKREIKNIWNITSFTKLNKENRLLTHIRNQITVKDDLINNKFKKDKNLNTYNFPVGKNTGLMIHYILKHLNFLSSKKIDWFSDVLKKYNIDTKWTQTIILWTHNITNTPLNNQKIILSKIKKESCIKELEFFLPIKKFLYSKELNEIIQSLDPISTIAPKLVFNPVIGILNGFIDLIFFWKDKYYIIDYKSNWIGKENYCYSNENIKKEMIVHRYDLQYQIYTMAVHQYLTKKIKNYNYKTHFGGIFYIFLRAVNKEKNNGIFYTMPNLTLIEKLMNLIS